MKHLTELRFRAGQQTGDPRGCGVRLPIVRVLVGDRRGYHVRLRPERGYDVRLRPEGGYDVRPRPENGKLRRRAGQQAGDPRGYGVKHPTTTGRVLVGDHWGSDGQHS
eukprot:CAMPEP_0180240344 /NCGR_PEP_ID=MMETSP0987-20121128/32041_1 /TAXON_ID=697907 /ORGANISM="non described non described, Strain CCMP2293" /LENGTH=107 /DNA_ID=CAMNT_0022207187 /DNA_START=307 /DNA_END=627 /DNA_ORIENTATION=-